MDGFAAVAEVAIAELPAALSEAEFAAPELLVAGQGARDLIVLVDLTAWQRSEA